MRLGLVAIGGVVAALLAAAPAHAAIFYYSGADSVAMGTQDSASIGCATGKALGGGIFSVGAYNTARVNASLLTDGPDADTNPDDGWIGFVDGLTGNTISATVACLQGAPGEALKYREEEGHLPGGKTGSLTARCPDGYKVTGGSSGNNGFFGEAALKGTRPVRSGTAWRSTTKNLSGGPIEVAATAICAKGGFAKKLRYITQSRRVNAGTESSRSISCPGNGRGVGGGVSVGKGSFLVNSVGITADGEGSQAYVDATGAKDVKFKTYAVCFG